jgi:hypothetical protein
MARARNIKPGLYKNEDLAECSIWARFIFPGLWMLADRAGRMEDRPKRIKGELLPYDSIEVDPLLDELARFGFILRYQVAGQRFLQVCKFAEHQTPHVREQASTIPPPPDVGQGTAKVVLGTSLGNDMPSPRSPDSLIPDSLIPDSLNPEQDSNQYPEAEENARAFSAVDLSVAMRKAGIQAQPADPRLIALASQGVSPETVAAACAEAKRSKPDETIGIGYVAKILERWAAEAASLKASGAATPLARASPGYQTANDKAKAFADRLTGRARNDQPYAIIDINDPPAAA